MNRLILSLLVLFALAGLARADYTGTVSEVKLFDSGAVALDLDGTWPNQKMLIYIPVTDVSKVTPLPKVGDVVTAVGPNTTYKGKPEIVIHDVKQLIINDSAK